MKAKYNKLWQMREKLTLHTLHVKSKLNREDSLKIIRGELVPPAPLTFTYNLGTTVRDLLPTSAVSRYLLSDRIFETFRKESFTGWQAYPVHVTGNNGEEVNGYKGLQVTGRAADRDRSRGTELPHVRGALIRKQGLFFQNDDWDGCDVFLCGLRICVTEQVQKALQNINVDNIDFIRLDKLIVETVSGLQN
jgi:hypothetical protein